MLKKLVAAVDGSPCGDHALELALRLAKVEGSSLIVCSAAYATTLYGSPGLVERVVAEIHEDARRIVDEALAKAQTAGIPAQGQVLEGEPVHQIVAYATKVKADAIVIGTHGRSGLNRFLMGSVAEGVLRSAPMPVLTVRAEARLAPLASEAAS
jgi:nucleotide-binding universal stress UspA family protein